MKKIIVFSLAAAVVFQLAAGQVSYTGAAEKASPHSGAGAPQGMKPLTGKVVETMDSGGYTYVRIDQSGKKTWLAIPQTKIVKGKTMSFYPGAEMVKFESKTLKRTFDRIIFSNGVVK